ncbi:hypothetical protein BELL_0251g00120 [Botrytis elliptica]|uniref:Uncharacterized protein n=1 Tax=Botrytis elliptica TaxID=278938 RepID=A0A4Z1JM99_9HELO|nr:hypothetical protein BELL_0251g00120 [Botrytis elliptica]
MTQTPMTQPATLRRKANQSPILIIAKKVHELICKSDENLDSITVGGKQNTLNLPPNPVANSPTPDDQEASLPGFNWHIRLVQKIASLKIYDVVMGR